MNDLSLILINLKYHYYDNMMEQKADEKPYNMMHAYVWRRKHVWEISASSHSTAAAGTTCYSSTLILFCQPPEEGALPTFTATTNSSCCRFFSFSII
mmetsp:Transcript_7364/g.12554  ORF Transcript_7364/g.12554 Transcript_7364/m.12554 type:complete len:97 (+) Transcript_7364:22-312(+)